MMEIRSYRRVFDLERRIYRIDRLRLNPGGVPVRGVVYVLALLATSMLVARLPILGDALAPLPWFMQYLLFPGATGAVLAVVQIEGRPFHLAVRALARHRARRAVSRGFGACRKRGEVHDRWSPEPLLMLPDGSGPRRRMRYRGPGAVLVAVAHERDTSRGVLVRLRLRADICLRTAAGAERPPSATVLLLERAARLNVR